MMPGMMYLPCRSVIGAEGGGFSFAAGPTHAMRPLSRIIAALGKGAWPVPSIRVKFLRTLTCATREVANNSANNSTGQATKLLRIRPGIFEDPLRARRIEDTTRAETREIGCGLLRGAPGFLDEVDHLLGQRMANHAVSTHGGKGGDLRVGNLFRLAFKAQGVAHAVAVDTRIVAAP